MPFEIEKKYKLSIMDFEQIAAKLQKLAQAQFSGEDFEVNEINGGGILTEKNAVLRVRKMVGKTLLTYKESVRSDSAIKCQIEHETEVGDAGVIENIIESLGYEKSLVYEKRRHIWHFNNVEIVLDELPFGLFMEIEGTVSDIERAETLLEAENFETEHETYPALTWKFGKKKGETIEARFE